MPSNLTAKEQLQLIHSAKAEVLRQIDEHLTHRIIFCNIADRYNDKHSVDHNFRELTVTLESEVKNFVDEITEHAA